MRTEQILKGRTEKSVLVVGCTGHENDAVIEYAAEAAGETGRYFGCHVLGTGDQRTVKLYTD